LFRATMCSSSEGQLYKYNFWYNHSLLVVIRYAGQDGQDFVMQNKQNKYINTRTSKRNCIRTMQLYGIIKPVGVPS